MAVRLSLTKSQLENPAAVELLALLQTITADGRLLDEEIEALNRWVSEQEDSGIPGIAHLRAAVILVLEDGRVSDEERKYLQKAVEMVLPVQKRDVAAMRRREAIAEDRATAVYESKRNEPIATSPWRRAT